MYEQKRRGLTFDMSQYTKTPKKPPQNPKFFKRLNSLARCLLWLNVILKHF